MRPLPTNYEVLTWISVHFPEAAVPKWKRIASRAFTSSVIVTNIIHILCSSTFFVNFVSINLSEALYALFQIAAGLSVTDALLVIFFFNKEIVNIFNGLSNIYHEHENENSFRFLAHENAKSEFLWDMYLKFYVGCYFFLNVGISVLITARGWFINGFFDSEYAYHSARYEFPWDQSTFFGYLAEKFTEIISGMSYLIVNGAFLLMFISICWHHRAFYRMFAHSLRGLNVDEIDKKFFCKLIRFQVMTRSWFMDSSRVYSLIIFAQLICSTLFLACVIFQLDLQLKEHDVNAVIMLFAAAVSVSNLFLYSYFAKLATDSFLKMSDCLYFDWNWPDLTIEFQKYVVFMIRNSQKPLYFSGFGITNLNLETFAKLLKNVITYYMMFKTLTSD